MIVARVPSFSKSSTETAVTYDIEQAGARLGCSCTAFAYAKKGAECKHLRLYWFVRETLVRCRALHGGTEDKLCLSCLLALLAGIVRKQRKASKRPRRKKD